LPVAHPACYGPPPVTPTTLPLGLPDLSPPGEHGLPSLGLTRDWATQRRLWGHAFHPMCSYLGSFPAALAHTFVARYSRPGDVVFDPFGGRGTVALEACVGRRIGASNDANPIANVVTAAKLDPPSRLEADARLAALRIEWADRASAWQPAADAGTGAQVERPRGGLELLAPQLSACFHPRALAQLLYLRRRLDLTDRVDRFLAAATLGILHGHSRGYVSDAMPNGFSLAPGYVAAGLARRTAGLPDRDVLALLDRKLRRLFRDGRPAARGISLEGDARQAGSRLADRLQASRLPHRARLVVTSPPYLRTLRYAAQNWLRLWFLGWDAADLEERLAGPADAAGLSELLRDVLLDLRPVLADDAIVVLILGDMATQGGRSRHQVHDLSSQVWEAAAAPLGYRLAGVASDPIAANRKLTRVWGAEAGRTTDTDRIMVLGASELGRRRALAGAAAGVDWIWPPRLPAASGPAILEPDAADVPPGRPGGHGSAGADEEPRPRPHDRPTPELRPAAAGAPVRA
jgi:DNA methylase